MVENYEPHALSSMGSSPAFVLHRLIGVVHGIPVAVYENSN